MYGTMYGMCYIKKSQIILLQKWNTSKSEFDLLVFHFVVRLVTAGVSPKTWCVACDTRVIGSPSLRLEAFLAQLFVFQLWLVWCSQAGIRHVPLLYTESWTCDSQFILSGHAWVALLAHMSLCLAVFALLCSCCFLSGLSAGRSAMRWQIGSPVSASMAVANNFVRAT